MAASRLCPETSRGSATDVHVGNLGDLGSSAEPAPFTAVVARREPGLATSDDRANGAEQPPGPGNGDLSHPAPPIPGAPDIVCTAIGPSQIPVLPPNSHGFARVRFGDEGV